VFKDKKDRLQNSYVELEVNVDANRFEQELIYYLGEIRYN
jgi:hypothetical protein